MVIDTAPGWRRPIAFGHDLSIVIPAERLQAREPGSTNPFITFISEAGVHGSRIGSLGAQARREPSGMTAARHQIQMEFSCRLADTKLSARLARRQ
jgi:hypothetical protein